MKRFIGFFAIMLLLAGTTFAQFTTNASVRTFDGGREVKFVFVASEAGGTYDSLRSNTFSFEEADHLTNFDIYYDINGSSCDSIVAQLYGSEDNSTFTILGSAGLTVSSGTLLDTVTTLTPTWTYSTFGELRARYYRLDIENLGQNTSTASTIIIRSRKKDY